MNLDWAIAIGVFLIFVTWSFVFYTQTFEIGEATAKEALEQISDKVLDNLTIEVYSMPVMFNAPEDDPNVVLFFEYRWPFGKNTTKVFSGSSSQTCNITDNTIYWQSSVSAGNNYFTVKFSEQKADLFCTGGFSVVNETQVIPFSTEKQFRISLARVLNMNATNYSVFKSEQVINRDFNITIENASGTVISYGLPPPPISNVFSKRILGIMEETGGNLTIRVLTW